MNTLEQSLSFAIKRLKENKDIPKYQFERAVDVMISPFLEEWLSFKLKKKVTHVINEFPIKKDDNNQSTNVDYLMRSGDEWIFIELKTDLGSLRENQVEFYKKAVNTGAQKLHSDLKDISKASKQKDKYKYLIEKTSNPPNTVHVIFLTPPENDKRPAVLEEIDDWGQWLSIEDFFADNFETKHPELWKLVRMLGEK